MCPKCVQTVEWMPVLGFLTCVQMLMHAAAHRGCTSTVRESALKVDSGTQTRVSIAIGLCRHTALAFVCILVSKSCHTALAFLFFQVSVSCHTARALLFFLVLVLSHRPSLVFFLVSVLSHSPSTSLGVLSGVSLVTQT